MPPKKNTIKSKKVTKVVERIIDPNEPIKPDDQLSLSGDVSKI